MSGGESYDLCMHSIISESGNIHHTAKINSSHRLVVVMCVCLTFDTRDRESGKKQKKPEEKKYAVDYVLCQMYKMKIPRHTFINQANNNFDRVSKRMSNSFGQNKTKSSKQ